MAVPKEERLILFDFDDEEDDIVSEQTLSEEQSQGFDVIEIALTSVEASEDMGLKVNNKYYQQFMDLFRQWDLDKQRYEKQQENLINIFQQQQMILIQHKIKQNQRVKLILQMAIQYIQILKNMEDKNDNVCSASFIEFKKEIAEYQKKTNDGNYNSEFQSIRGIVTSLCNDYGWINESVFFNTDVVSDNVPLTIGTNVLALVGENRRTHIFKAIKVKALSDIPGGTEPSQLGRQLCIRCVTSVTEEEVYVSKDTFFPLHMFSGAFKPFKGDLLLVEYSMNPGTSNISFHSVSPLNSQNMDEVCVTSIDGRNGVLDSSIFFTLDSLHTLPGYIPRVYDIVNATVVDSLQSHFSRRVVSMFPVDVLY